MVISCVVPGCRSNYHVGKGRKQKYITTFKFPKNEDLREAWVKAVGRENYRVTQNSSVCIKHFTDDCISSSSTNRVRLLPNAVPTIFPNNPNFSTQKQLPEEDKQEKELQSDKKSNAWLRENAIINFSNLVSNIDKKVNLNGWALHKSTKFVVLCVLEDAKTYHGCEFKFRIKINVNLTVRCFSGRVEISQRRYESILTSMKVLLWNQLNKLLSFISNMEPIHVDNAPTSCLNQALSLLQKYRESLVNENVRSLDIAIDQIAMLATQRCKYSKNSVKMTFSIFTNSRPSYSILSNYLAIPSTRYLRNLLAKTREIATDKNLNNVDDGENNQEENSDKNKENNSLRISESPINNDIADITQDEILSNADSKNSCIEWVDVDMDKTIDVEMN